MGDETDISRRAIERGMWKHGHILNREANVLPGSHTCGDGHGTSCTAPREKESAMPIPQQTGFAEVNGTRLYYEIAGSGHPLVLIHGSTLDTRMWDDQFEPFVQHYTVVRYDVRGFGQSALPTGEPHARPDDLKTLLE